jgi:hypothetical protein
MDVFVVYGNTGVFRCGISTGTEFVQHEWPGTALGNDDVSPGKLGNQNINWHAPIDVFQEL